MAKKVFLSLSIESTRIMNPPSHKLSCFAELGKTFSAAIFIITITYNFMAALSIRNVKQILGKADD